MKVSITGTGITKFGELWDKSLLDLAFDAGNEAIKESGLKKEQINALFVGNMLSAKFDSQGHLGPAVAQVLGLVSPAFHIEAACASGGLAIHLAAQAIEAGEYENVLVLGAEKMTDVSTAEAASGLMGAASEEERDAGLTFPGLYALMAQAYFAKYQVSQKDVAYASVKNHLHASLNENAQFGNKITVEQVLKSMEIANPLKLLDCSPISDGAAAVVLSKKESKKPFISASSTKTDTLSLSQRKTLTEIIAAQEAAKSAYRSAGVSPNDIDLAEVHDCFSIAEVIAMEDLSFCKKGEGAKLIKTGKTTIGGKMPVNTSGGLKACGHPVGATGVKQVVEITRQLEGRLTKRQVKNPKIGLTHNVGGTGATVVVNIIQN